MKITTFIKTITADPTQIITTAARVRYISIQANSGNTGNVFIGDASMTSSTGQEITDREAFSVSSGREDIDQSKFYLCGTADDVVRVFTIAGG